MQAISRAVRDGPDRVPVLVQISPFRLAVKTQEAVNAAIPRGIGHLVVEAVQQGARRHAHLVFGQFKTVAEGDNQTPILISSNWSFRIDIIMRLYSI